MKRVYLFAALLAALFTFPTRAAADWVQDGDAWVFRADASDKPDCGCGAACDCPAGACPNCASAKSATVTVAAPRGRYVQQCDGRTCRWVWVADEEPVAAPAVATAPFSSAVPVTSYASEGRRPVRRIFGAVFRPFRAIRGGGCCGG